MRRVEGNFREAHESDYGLAYLEPYLKDKEGHKVPFYLAIEQICREHELYKSIAESMLAMESRLDKKLTRIQDEVHYTLLRTGDAEKNARTLVHLWNSYNFQNNVTDYLPMRDMVTPPVENAIKEVGLYYKELAEKKRSRQEMNMDNSEPPLDESHSETSAPMNEKNDQSAVDVSEWFD